MSLVTTFRALIVVGLLCFAFLGITEHVYRPNASEDMAAFLEWDNYGSILRADLVPDEPRIARLAASVAVLMILSLLLILSFAQVAMLWFSHLGRTLSLVSAILWILLTPFFGVSASLPIEDAAVYLATLCEGGALAMAYFSPVSERFAHKSMIE